MGKYKTQKGKYEQFFAKDINRNIPKGLVDGVKEAERIAKEIGGHIPERVVDDGLLKRR